MNLCKVTIPLPFQLSAVPDAEPISMNIENTNIVFVCYSEQGARIFSFSGEDWKWLESEQPTIRIAACFPSGQEKTVRNSKIACTQKSPFLKGGVWDPAPYTTLHCLFETEVTRTPSDKTSFDRLHEFGFAAARRFIDSYRLVSNDAAGRTLRNIDRMGSLVAIAEPEYQFSSTKIGGHFADVSTQFHFPETKGEAFLQNDKVSVLHALRSHLALRNELFLYETMKLDAVEQSWVHGRHELSIVLSETAFEVFLQIRLSIACKQRKITKFRRRKGNRSVDIDISLYIEQGNVQSDLFPLADSFLGSTKGVRTMPEFTKWKADAYEKRNAIVHRGQQGIVEQDALNAFVAVGAFCMALDKALPR
jgi:hypothetical protein